MDKPLEIRMELLKEEHLDKLVKLENEAFAVPWSRGMFEEELKNPLAVYYVMFMDGRLVGYGGMWMVLNEGHITNIAVDPAMRRMGAGRRILEHLLAAGKKKGVDAYTLEVREGNEPAKKLYLSCGFKSVGKRKNYYSDNGEDAVIMWR